MRSKILLFLLIAASLLSGQTFQGPAAGSVASGVVYSTGNMKDIDPGTVFAPKPIRNLFTQSYMANIPDMPKPTAAEGANYMVDPLVSNPHESRTIGDFELTKSFTGIYDNNTSIPPDPYIAVGPDHIMQVVNSRIRISDKTGLSLKTINATTWFGATLSGASPFDPKVIYDHFSQRWVMVWLDLNNAMTVGYYLISVSDDSNPIGTWYNWALPSTLNGSAAAGNWADYQGVGYDKDAIYITSNQFTSTGSFQYVKLRILNKAELYANTAGALNWRDLWDISDIAGNDVFGVRPARIHGTPDSYYLLARSRYVTGTYFTLFKLKNPLGDIQLTAATVPVTAYSAPPDAAQMGAAETIDGGSDGLRNEPVYMDGKLHMVHAVKSGTGNAYSSVRYCAIDVATNTAVTDIAMGADTYFHSYPAVALDANQNVVITYTRSGTNEYAGAFYTTKPAASTVLSGSKLLKAGASTYYKTYGGTRNRWGDYMGAWFDPANGNKVWIYTEYVFSNNLWGNYVGELTFSSGAATISVISPNGGEYWQTGSNQKITWTSSNVTNLKLEYSTNNGTDWTLIQASVPAASGSYGWTVPNTASSTCLVKITDASNAAITDVSNSTFRIGTSANPFDWEKVASGVTAKLAAVFNVNSSVKWICGDSSVVLKSTNGGKSWISVTRISGYPNLYAIAAKDENIAVVGSETGTLYRTTNGGSSWTSVKTNSGSFIDVVDYAGNGVFYAIGDPVSSKWVLLKSTDDGATWTSASSLTAASGEAGWNCAYDRLGNKVWFGTNKTKIYKSDNALDGPWTSGATPSYTNSFGIAFSDYLKGLAVVNTTNAANGILKTTDGGATWTATSFPSTIQANIPDFVDGTGYAWIGTFQNGIYRTSDYGATWTSDVLPQGVTGVNAIRMYPDASDGIAVGDAGLILKSFHGSVVPVELTSFDAVQSGSNVTLAWKTSTEVNNWGFEVERKIDGGSWKMLAFKKGNGTQTDLKSYSYTDNISKLNANVIAYRLKQVDFNGTFKYSDEVRLNNVKPVAYALSQNYPNPFNPSTSISYQIPQDNFVSLRVFNSLGEEVATLVNEVKPAGTYTVDFNAGSLPSGIYIYRLAAGSASDRSNYVQTRKMVLVK